MAEKDRVRTKQFRFTLLPEENAMLTKNAFEYGLSKSKYLRKLILAESLAGKQWHMDGDQAKQLIYEVNRIGNNVNQIAYNTNVVRFSSNKDLGELQAKYFELMTLFCQFALRENGEESSGIKRFWS
nr:plasmid mobilization relaxosome protein MobC [uncultured Dorea sp.]